MEKLRRRHAAEKAAAIARGDIAPDDTPLLCSILKLLSNPWSAMDPTAPLEATVAAAAVEPDSAQRRGGSKQGQHSTANGGGHAQSRLGQRKAQQSVLNGNCRDEVAGGVQLEDAVLGRSKWGPLWIS